jgi:RNA polymerase sigma-32 factor
MAVPFHRRYGLPISDLIQEGHVGLMQAIARFAPDRDVRLSTYSTFGIRTAMQDYVLSNWSIVRSGKSSPQKGYFSICESDGP